jgi:hypothetical protein
MLSLTNVINSALHVKNVTTPRAGASNAGQVAAKTGAI